MRCNTHQDKQLHVPYRLTHLLGLWLDMANRYWPFQYHSGTRTLYYIILSATYRCHRTRLVSFLWDIEEKPIPPLTIPASVSLGATINIQHISTFLDSPSACLSQDFAQ